MLFVEGLPRLLAGIVAGVAGVVGAAPVGTGLRAARLTHAAARDTRVVDAGARARRAISGDAEAGVAARLPEAAAHAAASVDAHAEVVRAGHVGRHARGRA